jgi:hypothetical protein
MSALSDLDEPDKGDVATIRSAAEQHTADAQTGRTLQTVVRAAGSTVGSSNTSEVTAQTALMLTALGDKLDTTAASHEACAAALGAYATEVESIKLEAGLLRTACSEAERSIGSLRGTLSELSPSTSLLFTGWDDPPARIPESDTTSLLRGMSETDVSDFNSGVSRWGTLAAEIEGHRESYAALLERRLAADGVAVAALSGTPVSTIVSGAQVDGATAIAAWATVDGATFAAAYADDPQAAADALSKMSPAEVAGLWQNLPPEFVAALIAAAPAVVGNLEGASYTDRDRANVSRLQQLYDDAKADYEAIVNADGPYSYDGAPGGGEAFDKMQGLKYLLDRYGDGLGPTRVPPLYLISLDNSAPGVPLAAISVGDLDTAKFATFFVPGMESSVSSSDDYVRAATRMQQENAESAVVVWVDYDSPNALEVPSNARAEAGAERLSRTLDGYNAYREAANLPSQLNLVGHFYGTTTISIALADKEHHVDTVTFLGSAGIPDDISIDDLHVDPEKVFVTDAEQDHLADFGRFVSGRQDPERTGWGATLFGSDGTVLADGTELDPAEMHNAVGGNKDDDDRKYLGEGSESLYNVRKIITGQDELITEGRAPVEYDASQTEGWSL